MKTAFFMYTKDREDGGPIGFSCALEIPEEKTKTFEQAINFLMPILQSEKFVKRLIEEDFLAEDLFKEQPFKFVSCGYENYSLAYVFEYIGDDPDSLETDTTLVVEKQMHFIDLVSNG